ncbi:MAG: hypothetical protein M3Y76_07685, partial [Chloroflexota bacterium]|nr:hypothetical protein [Chloroflexota bacterium]
VQHYTHFFKFIGLALVGLAMVGLIVWMDYRQRHRGERIKLGGPETPLNGDSAAKGDDSEKKEAVTEYHSEYRGSGPSQLLPDSPHDEHLQAQFPH